MRPDPGLRHLDSETLDIVQGVTLIRLGGRFPGGTVLTGLMAPRDAARS